VYVILVYDIAEEENGTRRQRNIFKICKKYLIHIQNSVFEGDTNPSHLARMKKELMPWIDKNLDSVIIFKSREERWLTKEFYGKDESDVTSNFL
jgi:CRISPR-associated protein Cas2